MMSRGRLFFSFSLPAQIQSNHIELLINCIVIMRVICKARRTFPFVDCRLHPFSYLYYNLKRRSMSPPPFLLSHSYRCMHIHIVFITITYSLYAYIYSTYIHTGDQ